MLIEGVLLIVFGLVIGVNGVCGKKPFHNTVDMPLTKEEKEDTRPPAKLERTCYIGFGLALVAFGVWKVTSAG